MRERLTYKFGGSCLDKDRDYENAARFLLEDSKSAPAPVCVVVSARKGKTNRLLKEAAELFGNNPWAQIDYVVKKGEFASAEKLSWELNKLSPGKPARVSTPYEWRIMAEGENPFDSRLIGTNVALADIRDPINYPIPAGFLIIPGYVGVHTTKTLGTSKALVALGRGASDLIAVEIARATESKLKLVKSAQSVYSVSPGLVRNPKPISHMTPEQALRVLEYIRSDEQFIMAEAVRHAQRKNVPLEFCSMENPEESSRIDSLFRPNESELFRALPVKENVVLIRAVVNTNTISGIYEKLHAKKIPFNDGGTEAINGESRLHIFAETRLADRITSVVRPLVNTMSVTEGSLITLIDTSLDPEGNHFMRAYKALRGIPILHSVSSGIIMHIFVQPQDTKRAVQALAEEFELLEP
ncbi:MAG: hypothetical protein WD712_01805 [Candidatus Spechtbacterales bacterium]